MRLHHEAWQASLAIGLSHTALSIPGMDPEEPVSSAPFTADEVHPFAAGSGEACIQSGVATRLSIHESALRQVQAISKQRLLHHWCCEGFQDL